MLRSSIPTKFQLAFGTNAPGGNIRAVPVTTVDPNAASESLGFPTPTLTPISSGGVPPDGRDFNGLFNQITAWDIWYAAGGALVYDSAFSTAIGGYPAGATLMSALVLGNQWLNTVDNNTTDPDSAGSSGWVAAPGTIASGTPIPSFTDTVPYGYVAGNALTVGNASSNATSRGNADTWFLFSFIWSRFSNTQCPIFTSAGGASSRGANAAADFAANKAISTPNMKGLGVLGVDTMGGIGSSFLANVPVTSGSVTVPGSVVGENLHVILLAELAQHLHGVTDLTHSHGFTPLSQVAAGPGFFGGSNGSGLSGGGTDSATTANQSNISIQNAGSNTAHNTVERNMLVYWNLKL